jgi:hypothetical protein
MGFYLETVIERLFLGGRRRSSRSYDETAGMSSNLLCRTSSPITVRALDRDSITYSGSLEPIDNRSSDLPEP